MANKLDKSAQEQIRRLHEQEKAEKQAAKDAKKAARKSGKGEGRWSQIKQVFSMTRKAEPKVPWIMLAIVLGMAVIGGALGWLIGNWITFGIIGLVIGLLLAVIYMNRRAEKAAFSQIEGRPGASGAALSTMGRGWIVKEEPISVSPKTQDLVFMAIGRPGVVLVTEGPTARVHPLADSAKRNITRAVKNVPITVVNAGSQDGQIALPKVRKELKALKKAISRQEIKAVDQRLATLNLSKPPIPKGIDPNRARPNRKALRGR
jgi:ABC-type multidrug transport system fused ATPase/permease subunit